jgi:hypothetical protein
MAWRVCDAYETTVGKRAADRHHRCPCDGTCGSARRHIADALFFRLPGEARLLEDPVALCARIAIAGAALTPLSNLPHSGSPAAYAYGVHPPLVAIALQPFA